MGELFHVLKFMSGIAAIRSEESAVSVVHSIAAIVNEPGCTSYKFALNLSVAHELINECRRPVHKISSYPWRESSVD